MFKKIIEVLIKTMLWLFIVLTIGFLWMNYFAWQYWKVKNWESFCKNEQYTIWQPFNNRTLYFCDNNKKGKCLDGIIISNVESVDKSLYLYFELWNFIWKDSEAVNKMVSGVDSGSGYVYNVFWNDYVKYYAKSDSEVIRFLKVNNECNLHLYSSKDIEKLDQKESAIFNALKIQKTLVVNGKKVDNLNP